MKSAITGNGRKTAFSGSTKTSRINHDRIFHKEPDRIASVCLIAVIWIALIVLIAMSSGCSMLSETIEIRAKAFKSPILGHNVIIVTSKKRDIFGRTHSGGLPTKGTAEIDGKKMSWDTSAKIFPDINFSAVKK